MRRGSIVVMLIAWRALAQDSAVTLPRPTPQQAAWHDLEVGMFIHLAPQTWQDSESDTMATPLSAINPEKLDTDQWVRVAESMGAKYIVFVAKHEGGFCWWPTETTDYSVKSIPWHDGKGDVMRNLAKSCQDRGMKLGVYLSPQDKKHAARVGGKTADPTKQSEYESMFRAQLTELLTRYGSMMEVWFDGSLVFDVGDILREHAPNAVVFQGPQASIRWVGNEDGFAPDPAWSAVKFGIKDWGHYTAADGDPAGDRWLPNECDARIRNTWFWRTDNEKALKSVAQLMDMYERSVGHGGVLLLNQTPDRSGLIPQSDARRAAEFGAEIERVYGTPIAQTGGRGVQLELTVPGGGAPPTIDRVVIAEDITLGERIRRYVIEGRVAESRDSAGEWIGLAEGTAVGHKKIDRPAPARVSAVRLRILESVGEPAIRTLSLHRSRAAEGEILSAARDRARPHPDLQGYTLAWHDEFDGPTLDETKWAHYAPGKRREAVNVAEAVTFDGQGNLVITTSRHEPPADTATGPEIRTGMISTRGLFETTYGYFECRMRMQREVGHWSAFWINTPTMGNPVGDPAAAGVEIDVIEYLRNGDYPVQAQHTIHWDHKTPQYKRDFAAPIVPDLGEGFHTFGCEWTTDYLAFFVDGRETWRTTAAIPRRDQHLILSVEVGKWADDIAKATLPDSITVDYVRVFKKETATR